MNDYLVSRFGIAVALGFFASIPSLTGLTDAEPSNRVVLASLLRSDKFPSVVQITCSSSNFLYLEKKPPPKSSKE